MGIEVVVVASFSELLNFLPENTVSAVVSVSIRIVDRTRVCVVV